MHIIQTQVCVHVPNVKFKLVLCQNDTKGWFKTTNARPRGASEGAPFYTQTNLNIP